MDVINMSLGSPFSDGNEPAAIAANNATAAGVTVVASAGNNGHGAYLTGGPSAATRAISVAAMDGGRPDAPGVTIDLAGVGAMAVNNGVDGFPITGFLDVLMSGTNLSVGCDEAEYTGAAGKIVVALRGTCDRVLRATYGQTAGALAVILVNSLPGLPPYEGTIPGVSIPFLGAEDASASAFLGADGQTHTLTAAPPIPSPTYRHMADFTSGGLRTGDSAAKPDITAPGVATFSTLVGSGTLSEGLSGTSMASPHVAGVAALVAQAHPSWTPDQIKAAIMNTATVDASVLASSDDRDPRLAGSGAVQARKAVDTEGARHDGSRNVEPVVQRSGHVGPV